MEIRQLEAFLCVAKHLSFSKAAEAMYVSQPTVSAYIGGLEKYLGVQLFVRNTKEVSLTKAGLDFLAYAQKILSLRDQALDTAKGEEREVRGALDIIASTIPAQHLLPEIITAFHQQWPKVVFRVDQADSHQVEQRMGSFHYDFGMMGVSPDNTRFVHHPIYNDELVLILPNSTPQSNETLRQEFARYICQAPFLMRESGSGTRMELEMILAKIGIAAQQLQVIAYFADAHSILLAVARGMGVSLISKVAAAMYVEAGYLRAVELDSALFRRQIHLLHNKELWLTPLQQAFADHARRFYGQGVDGRTHGEE